MGVIAESDGLHGLDFKAPKYIERMGYKDALITTLILFDNRNLLLNR